MTIKDARLKYERRVFRQRDENSKYKQTDAKLKQLDATYSIFADCISIKVPHKAVFNKIGGIRGKCKGFSKASRLNMKKHLARLRLEGKYCFFVTLSYPGEYVKDMQVSKRDLQVFKKAFYRAFPSFAGGFWRLEIQKRGAPHYHMLLISDSPVSKKKIVEFMRERWPNIVRTSYLKHGGSEEEYRAHYERHKNSGHNVQFMKSREMVQNYISKYISKLDETVYPDDMGRIWGQWQFPGKELDFSADEIGTITHKETVMLKRMVRKHKEASNRLSMREREMVELSNKTGIRDKELDRKLRRHKSDKRYAKKIAKRSSVTLFGYGTESKNGAVIKKMVDATHLLYAMDLFENDGVPGCVSTDLINTHILPSSCDGTINEKAVEGSPVVGDTALTARDGPGGIVEAKKGHEKAVSRQRKPAFTTEEWRKSEELQIARVRACREKWGLALGPYAETVAYHETKDG